jgi:hypothetical protein
MLKSYHHTLLTFSGAPVYFDIPLKYACGDGCAKSVTKISSSERLQETNVDQVDRLHN